MAKLKTLLVVGLVVAGCGGNDIVPLYADADQSEQSDAEARSDGASRSAEVGAPDVLPVEIDAPEPGEFGWPCYSNADCLEGLCVESFGAFVCSQTCEEECPEDWVCGDPAADEPDGNYCMPPHGTLCRPCQADGDCKVSDAIDAACVNYGGSGLFCATSCELGTECPLGFACGAVELSDGSVRSMCLRSEGTCACAKKYGIEVLTTACYNENMAGICHGERTCTAGVLSACSAAVPAAESCNGLDDDCDGETDEPGAVGCLLTYPDGDGDGYGLAGSQPQCLCPSEDQPGATQAGDCDDSNESTHPGAPEQCDGEDNNCNGFADEGLLMPFYFDNDGDGFGTAGAMQMACAPPEGYVALGTDCLDFNEEVFPGADEVCNDLDDNCNGLVDDGLELVVYHADNDDDGFGSNLGLTYAKCAYPDGVPPLGWALSATDCGDNDPTIFPGAPTLCDGKDNNCDGITDQLCFVKCSGAWPYLPGKVVQNPTVDVADLEGDGSYEVFYNSGHNFSVLTPEAAVVFEILDDSPGFQYRSRTRFADLDDADWFGPGVKTLEALSNHALTAAAYRLTEDGGMEAIPSDANLGCGGGQALLGDLDFDGHVEWFTSACCDPMFRIHQFDPEAGAIETVAQVEDPYGICAVGAGLLLVDLDDDGEAELLAGNGNVSATTNQQWGGQVSAFAFADGDVESSNPYNLAGGFDISIAGLYPVTAYSFGTDGESISMVGVYYDTPEFESLYDRLFYLWRFNLAGEALDGYPKLLEFPSQGSFDADKDGEAEPYPTDVSGSLYDVNGDGYPDLLGPIDEELRIYLFNPATDGWELSAGSSLNVNDTVLRSGAVWDIDGDGELELLFSDASERIHCYQLGPATFNPLSSVPSVQSSHYPSGRTDSFEPNGGEDVDGDGLPDRARHLPSAMTAQGNFYSYLNSADDEDFYVVDTEWGATICLQSPEGRVYNLAVYGTADMLNNVTQQPGKDGVPDGLIWSDDSDEPYKCFTAGLVNPPRWDEYKFIIRVWTDGAEGSGWPYWLEIPK